MTKKLQRPISSLCVICLATCLCYGLPAHAQEKPEAPVQGAAQSAQTKGDPGRFDILEYEIEGNTVLPAVKIETAVYPWLGPALTVQDVEQARQSLEKAYQDAGFLTVLVEIPEQKVAEGIVRLHVTEGKVQRLHISGSRYYSLGMIRALVPAAEEGSVPSFPELQEQLANLNRIPDRRITPLLRPGKTPGTVEVELKVEDELPLHGGIELDNRYSANTSHLRATVSGRYDNLWQRQHSLALQYQMSPEDTSEVKVLSGTYLWPFVESGNLLALYGVSSKSHVVTSVGGTSVLGNGTILGARFIVPLRSGEGFFQSFTAGIDHKDFSENVLFGSDQLNTPIAYTPLSAQYSGTWINAGVSSQLTTGVSFALRGLMGNSEDEFEQKRHLAHAGFAIWHLEAQHSRSFGGGWGILVKGAAQFAGAPINSNEQFSVGGVDSVRGYLESEAFGDDGLSGRIEARTPALWGERDGPRDEFYALMFLEGASVRLYEPLESQKPQQRVRLASGGIGVRFKAWKRLTAAADVGLPFRKGIYTSAWDPRVHFKLSVDF